MHVCEEPVRFETSENANLMTLQMPECFHEKLMMKTEGEVT